MQLIVRYRLTIVLVVAVMALAPSCNDGDTGPQGPVGPVGAPRPIKLLIAGATGDRDLNEMVIIAYRDQMFPLGSQIDWFNVRDATPSLETLMQYDVVFCWSLQDFGNGVLLGNRLADYIDNGGKLVIAQFAYAIPAVPSAAKGPLKGRVMTTGYSPLTSSTPTRDLSNKRIDMSTLDFPIHPIFNLVSDGFIDFFAQSDFSDPGLDPTATLLAADTDGDNAVAINAAGNIIGLNLLGYWGYQDVLVGSAPYPEANRLMVNCILWIAGAY